MEDRKIFKRGICFAKLFVVFLIGCVFGTIFEELIYFFKYGSWTNRQAMIFGPFNPIYGIPAVVYVLFLAKGNEKRGIIKTYIYSVIIGGVSEYLVALFIEKAFGVKFWDYAGYFLNIQGRTTIPFMLFWGVLGVILIKVIYPYVSKLLEKIPDTSITRLAYTAFLVFMIFNTSVTFVAFDRMNARNNGKEAQTIIGKICDNIFSNEYMIKKFPAMAENSDNL